MWVVNGWAGGHVKGVTTINWNQIHGRERQHSKHVAQLSLAGPRWATTPPSPHLQPVLCDRMRAPPRQPQVRHKHATIRLDQDTLTWLIKTSLTPPKTDARRSKQADNVSIFSSPKRGKEKHNQSKWRLKVLHYLRTELSGRLRSH